MESPSKSESTCRDPRIEEENDDDDPPLLSSHALAALKEFLDEQAQTQPDVHLESGVSEDSEVALVTEDWRLSQFWYDRDTAETVTNEVLTLCQNFESPRVACIACPTLYTYLKKLGPHVSAQLLEYDERFSQHGSEFTFYDYNEPEELPMELKHDFQIVIADPPYLSKECLEKVTRSISFLAQNRESYLLLLTGEVQAERAAELMGFHPCGFRPHHSSKLGNEFRLFTNYDPGSRLGGWEQ
ncbi:EEF1A lysine methyltransferase 1, partial [Cucurbita argyrosperma subsp. argyrosperma]